MAGTAYPKRAIKQNRRTTRAKIGKPVKLARMGEIDYTFLFIVILLLSFGLVMLLSASAPAGNTLHNNSYYFLNNSFVQYWDLSECGLFQGLITTNIKIPFRSL